MTEQELIAAVSELSRTKFASRARDVDEKGRFPTENIAELKELGIPGMALAKDLGGLGVSPTTQIRIMEEIGYGDASTAVALNMHVLGADFLSFMPPFPRRNAVLEDIGKNGALMCGPASVPTGELDNRKAGFRMRDDGDHIVINGKAGFASMSEGAKYTIMAGLIERDDDQEPDLALTLPELSTPGIKLLYNWDALGLRGTASHDIVAEEARIPKSETLIIPQAMLRVIIQAQGSVSTPMTQNRAKGGLGIAAIWLGLAQAAFDFTIDYVKHRHGYLAGPTITIGTGPGPGFRSDQAWAQFGIGNMEHWLETARIVLYDTVRRLDEPFPDPQAFTRHISRTVYHLRRMSEEVSQGAMKVCGAHAYVKARELERIFRDMVGGNVMAWKTDELLLSLGQGALGMPITFVGPAGT
ncbi:MAG: acyl-CoA/acyl-ACP dehydrogenase [Dehalococcoidia bacterium]|nr:acyl-CoA/acyl-ACP dehydrogenase [Dehalococcoidia bacterium]